MKTICLATLLFCIVMPVSGQNHFALSLDTITISGLPGLHSFAFAEHDGKWLLLAGRRDGLHPKFGGFGTGSANKTIIVADPAEGQVWQKSIAELPDTLREQMQSANMEFCRYGDLLCFAGGYGESNTAGDHITYPFLTLINVPGLMETVMNGGELQPHFQQIRDTFFAVTGGQMQVLNDTFYLVGGHRFEGIYSALGGNTLQEYTQAIRKFNLEEQSGVFQLSHKSEITDELNLHRRDYNLVPQIMPDGSPGLTAFSGVFQPGLALLPFLNVIEITPAGHEPVNGFSQFLSNYHCAKVPLYDPGSGDMHTLFFGGMSQYYLDQNDSLIRDNRIPFVRTVSRVTRHADGSYEEVAFDTELPFYTGSSAEFIPAENLPLYDGEIVDFSQLPEGETLLGYIVGGIVTPEDQPNPFVANNTGITSASAVLLRVTLDKQPVLAAPQHRLDGQYDLDLRVFPNPFSGECRISLYMPRAEDLLLILQNDKGQMVQFIEKGKQQAGKHVFRLETYDLPPGIYRLTANAGGVFLETVTVIVQ